MKKEKEKQNVETESKSTKVPMDFSLINFTSHWSDALSFLKFIKQINTKKLAGYRQSINFCNELYFQEYL